MAWNIRVAQVFLKSRKTRNSHLILSLLFGFTFDFRPYVNQTFFLLVMDHSQKPFLNEQCCALFPPRQGVVFWHRARFLNVCFSVSQPQFADSFTFFPYTVSVLSVEDASEQKGITVVSSIMGNST